MTVTTWESMPRLEVLLPDTDGMMNAAPAPANISTADAISTIASKRRRDGKQPTGFFLSPQRFLALRMELAPQTKAMHVQPLYNSNREMVKAAIAIKEVPVFEDDNALDGAIYWTEVPA